MIFKGNTKLTPALTELLDDNTPSNKKTYSSEKIETLIGGGGGGGLELYATIDNTKLKNLLNSDKQFSFFDSSYKDYSARSVSDKIITKNDFTILKSLDENNYKFILTVENGSLTFSKNYSPSSPIDLTLETRIVITNSYKISTNIFFDVITNSYIWARTGKIFENIMPSYYIDFKNLIRIDISYIIQYIMGGYNSQILLNDNTNITSNNTIINVYAIPKS